MRFRIAVAMLGALSVSIWSAQPPKEIKKVPVTQTSPVSGSEMFRTYCAVCHGVDGKGGGPAADSLKQAPADLTQLTILSNGKYPEDRVSQSISGNLQIRAHGSPDMPMCGDLFKSLNGGNDNLVRLRVANLTDYIKSIQAK